MSRSKSTAVKNIDITDILVKNIGDIDIGKGDIDPAPL